MEEEEGERGGAGSHPSTAGHGRARCSLPGCQRAGDVGGPAWGGTGPGGTAAPQLIAAQPPAHRRAPLGHCPGTRACCSRRGQGWVWLPLRACRGQGWAPAPLRRRVSPGQGHHDPAELVLCHLGSLGEVLGVLPPAPPRLPPPGGKWAPPGRALGSGSAGGAQSWGGLWGCREMGVQAGAGPACCRQRRVKPCTCMPGCRACPLPLLSPSYLGTVIPPPL